MPLNIPAIKFFQKKIPMYLTALPIEELDHCSIDRWDPQKTGKWKGYQRGLVQKKINNLAEYLERADGIMPVAGLLNVREKNMLQFKAGVGSSVPIAGMLTIPDYARLWVVDMQHRLEGVKLAHSKGLLNKFSVPVLITEGLSDVNEAAQFYIVNTKAKRMGVDLTRRLLIEHNCIQDITDVKPWELKAVQIAIILNKKIKNSPWHGRIREPETESLRNQIATEKSFIPSLKWLLTSPQCKRKSARHLARFLANYWEGLRLNMPEAFENPKSFLIQKTPGYMAFHRIAPIAYRKIKQRGVGNFEKLFRVLQKGKFDAEFWRRQNPHGAKKYGTGQSAYANLAMDLTKALGI